MRWFWMLSVMVCIAPPTAGAKRLTIDQLQQLLDSAARSHKSDADLTHQLNSIELSQRLTATTLQRLSKPFQGHVPVALTLQLLADQSAFLDPPAEELPHSAPLDSTEQKKQLEAARAFVLQILPNLPNLLATKTTFNFDDSPQVLPKGGWAEREGLHLVGQSKSEVSVRKESESVSSSDAPGHTSAQAGQASGGLISWGEFGVTLITVFRDAESGSIVWDHWETGPAGPISVFRYEVPKNASHYELVMPTVRSRPMIGTWTGTAGGIQNSSRTVMVHSKPAYHGSLSIDPKTGAILRISLVADLKGDSTLQRGAILVEYGSVTIGDRTFICPTRSLALSSAAANVRSTLEGQTTLWLNENLFNDYHLFASTSRILPETAANSEPASPQASEQSEQPSATAASLPVQDAATAALETAANQTANAPQAEPTAPPPQTVVASESTPAAGDQQSRQSSAPQAAASVPLPAVASTAQPQADSALPSHAAADPDLHEPLRVNVNAVLIPVIVRARDGSSVDGLTRQDFSIFDDGKPREITGFSVERGGANPVKSSGLPDRVTVFFFDDMHMSVEQIAPAQKAVLKALDAALTGTDVAAVVSASGKINSGLTNDREKLSQAVMAVQPLGIYKADSTDCPNIGYYQADLIRRHDPEAIADALKQVTLVCNPNLPADMAQNVVEQSARRVLTLSEQDVMTAYASISEFVRRMARLPGQHRLILVSTGFLPIEEEARAAESKLINLAIESNVSISALDARGLYTSSLTASDKVIDRDPSQVGDYRVTERRLAENTMGELADGTGGDFFHNNNDLDSGMRMLVSQPETMYILQFKPDPPRSNGASHRLSVKVDRDHLEVHARKSYFVASKRDAR